MQSSRVEISSDLNRARELSRRLTQSEPSAPPPAPARSAPPRFTASKVPGVPAPVTAAPASGAAAAPAPAVDPRAPTPWPGRVPPLPAAATFEARTNWCREALGADAIFLLDERGLLVAASGGMTPSESEGIGARLVFSFEQADAMRRGADRTRSIAVEFGNSCLTGWRFPIDGVTLTLGVVTPKPLAPGAAAIVARAYASLKRG